MDTSIQSLNNMINISWWGFILMLLVCSGLLVLYFIVIKQVLQRIPQAQKRMNILLYDRFVLFGYTFLFLILLFLVNPILHGLVLGVLLLLSFPSIRQVIRGLAILSEAKLRRGQLVEVEGTRGVIHKIGWTSLSISSGGKAHIIPYMKISKTGLSISDKTSFSRLHTVICSYDLSQRKYADIRQDIEALFFAFPFYKLKT